MGFGGGEPKLNREGIVDLLRSKSCRVLSGVDSTTSYFGGMQGHVRMFLDSVTKPNCTLHTALLFVLFVRTPSALDCFA